VLAILFVARFVPGIEVTGLYIATVVALLWGLVNIFIKPVLIMLTLPLNLLTLGLFTFVLNALLFWFVASFVEGFSVEGFLPALLGTLVISAISWIGNRFV
jgi:putative membrane protein